MALHSMVNRQTGFTPNQMMLGRETIQPVQLLLGIPQMGQDIVYPSDWVTRLVRRMEKIHDFARQHLRTSQHRQKKDYDLRVVAHRYQAGDLVYKADSATKVGQSKKLRSPWCGPFLVVSSNPPLYKIRGRKGDSVVHHDRLKLCSDRDIPTWIRRLRHALFKDDSGLDESWDMLDETIPYGLDVDVQDLFSDNQSGDDALSDSQFVAPQLSVDTNSHNAITPKITQEHRPKSKNQVVCTSDTDTQSLDLCTLGVDHRSNDKLDMKTSQGHADAEGTGPSALPELERTRRGRPIRRPPRFQ